MKIQLLLILSLLYGCAGQPTAPSALPQQLPVASVSSGTATTYREYPASVEGTVNVEIRPQIAGILLKTFVDDGAHVNKGEAIFEIDPAPFREKLNNAKASLHAAQGALSNAQLEIDKLTPLVQNKVISDYQLKTAQSAREIALANVEQAKADIATAKINIGYTLIKAPVSGYIGLLARKVGSLVGPSDPSALTTLSDVHEVHVFFALGESDFIRFKDQYPGKTVEEKLKQLPPIDLILADDSAFVVKGKVDLINGQFDRTTGAITFRATFKNTDGLLRAGNTGKVRLGLQFAKTLMVPQASTSEMQDQTFVFLVQPGNKVTKQFITVSGKSGNNFLVSKGLKDGDVIVSAGFDHLHEGDLIKPDASKAAVIINPIVKN